MQPLYAPSNDRTLDDSPSEQEINLGGFIGQKSRLLRTKLEVLALEMATRFHVRDRNIDQIANDKGNVEQMLASLTRLSNYHLREHRDKAPLYQKLFDLEAERRKQEADCWSDVAMVMRDFLYAWEAFELARARLHLFSDVGQ